MKRLVPASPAPTLPTPTPATPPPVAGTAQSPNEFFESVQRLTRDIRNASITLSDHESRWLVDAYYQLQRDRIRSAHQMRTLAQNNEPHDVIQWLEDQRSTLEKQIARALDAYSASKPSGVWARSIVGIGPIITAGLLAHIDIKMAPTAGHIWRFAGLDPTVSWDKGKKRPWNGSLKRLCWIVGESFTKVSNNERDTYGKLYQARKAYEVTKNTAGDYAEQARASLAAKKFGADTEARKHYEAGHLPPARIHLRAERFAVKRFLSDLHAVMYFLEFNALPPKPWVITHGGHVHYVEPPNLELVQGMSEAYAAARKQQ
jgi:hypothetical protein